MIFNRAIGLMITLLLLFIGNLFGFIKISTAPTDFLREYPSMTTNSLFYFRIIQVLNIIGISGIFMYQKWAVWFALMMLILVIILDIYFAIWYHIVVVIIINAFTAYFIYKSWQFFK